ncbi:MAG: transcriptional regulator with XRE-family HTH domain [Myxococcota bacterium]|jgi:transcriptional regulator with XRE-family HTH domain
MIQSPQRSTPVTRKQIGLKVRELRKSRRWTQAELSERLGLSQNRLSELERGQGSFSAEQFLEILRLFNVGVDEFDPSPDPAASLQNALARFGARHLRESEVLPESQHTTPADAIIAVLLDPSSARLVTALAPVLVWSIDEIALPMVQHSLVRAGRPWRLPWLVENALEAISDLKTSDWKWRLRLKRAPIVLDDFGEHQDPPKEHDVLDPLEPGIRSPASRRQVWENASKNSRRWRVVSTLQVSDFAQALREACEH